MKKVNNKTGFSLAELIVILTIISFIIILEMMIVNKKTNEYGAAYYDAYNSLRKVAYNVFSDDGCPDPERAQEKTAPGYHEGYDCSVGPRTFPKDAEELCKRFSEYFNIPGGVPNCQAEKINIRANNFLDEDDKDKKASLMFRTSNSYKFYISQAETPHADVQGEEDDIPNHSYTYQAKEKRSGGTEAVKTVEYFIVYIDINGDKKPNSVKIDDNYSYLYPDIVPFAVTRRGEVIPMGFPLYMTTYITARVRYPDKDDEEANDGSVIEDISESMSLYNAIRVAWRNGEADFDIPLTYRLTEEASNANSEATTFFMKNGAPDPQYINDLINIYDEDDKEHNKKGCEAHTVNCTVNIEKSGYVRN